MNKLMNSLAYREIFSASIHFLVFAPIALLMWNRTEEFHESTLFWGISTVIYVLFIMIILCLRLQNPLDTENIERSCLGLGVIFAVWNLQVLYFHNSYSLIVIFILGVGLPGIILFLCNKHFHDVQENFVVLIGYYLVIFYFLNIFTYYHAARAYIAGAAILVPCVKIREEIWNGKNEEIINKTHFRACLMSGGVFILAYILIFANFATDERYFHPLPQLLFAMLIIFTTEHLLWSMKQKTGGSKLADVFS